MDNNALGLLVISNAPIPFPLRYITGESYTINTNSSRIIEQKNQDLFTTNKEDYTKGEAITDTNNTANALTDNCKNPPKKTQSKTTFLEKINKFYSIMSFHYTINIEVARNDQYTIQTLNTAIKTIMTLQASNSFNKWVNYVSFSGIDNFIEYGNVKSFQINSVASNDNMISYTLVIDSYEPKTGSGNIASSVGTL